MFVCLYICIMRIDTKLCWCIHLYVHIPMYIVNRAQWLGVVGRLCPPEAEGPEHPGLSSGLLHKPGRHREAQNQGWGHHQEGGRHDSGAWDSSAGEAWIVTTSPPSQCRGPNYIHMVTCGPGTFDILRLPEIITSSKRYASLSMKFDKYIQFSLYFHFVFSFCFYFLQCFVCTGSNHYRKPSTNMWDFFVKNANGRVKVCVLF